MTSPERGQREARQVGKHRLPEVHAVLDTCVLYPAPLYNTLLYSAYHRVYQPLWTDHILEELRRTMIADGRKAPAQVERRLRAMAVSFEPGANLDRRGLAYQPLIARMPNHPKDRHVLAAAVAAEADYLVTENRKDFRLIDTPYQHLAVVGADDFLVALSTISRWHQLNLLSALYLQVRDSGALATVDALLERLVRHNGLARFADHVRKQHEQFGDWPSGVVAAIIGGEQISDALLRAHGLLP